VKVNTSFMLSTAWLHDVSFISGYGNSVTLNSVLLFNYTSHMRSPSLFRKKHVVTCHAK